jgi:hypothetical protein
MEGSCSSANIRTKKLRRDSRITSQLCELHKISIGHARSTNSLQVSQIEKSEVPAVHRAKASGAPQTSVKHETK